MKVLVQLLLCAIIYFSASCANRSYDPFNWNNEAIIFSTFFILSVIIVPITLHYFKEND